MYISVICLLTGQPIKRTRSKKKRETEERERAPTRGANIQCYTFLTGLHMFVLYTPVVSLLLQKDRVLWCTCLLQSLLIEYRLPPFCWVTDEPQSLNLQDSPIPLCPSLSSYLPSPFHLLRNLQRKLWSDPYFYPTHPVFLPPVSIQTGQILPQ